MTCEEFKTRLATLSHPEEMPAEMQAHTQECAACAKALSGRDLLHRYIAGQKSRTVSPFLKTRVMAAIERPVAGVWYARPALVTVLSAIVFVFGILSANLMQPSTATVEPMEAIAADYYFQDNPGLQLEETWFNTSYYEE